MDFDCQRILEFLPDIIDCFLGLRQKTQEHVLSALKEEYSGTSDEKSIARLDARVRLLTAAERGEDVAPYVAKIAELKAD